MSKYLNWEGLQYYNSKISPPLSSLIDNSNKNVLDYSLTTLKKLNTSGSWNNNIYTKGTITFTVNDDMSITVNGTTDSQVTLTLTNLDSTIKNIRADNYALSGCPEGGSVSTYVLYAYMRKTTSPTANGADVGNGFIGEFDYSNADATNPNISIVISSKTSNTPLTFYPMLCTEANWTLSKTYQPFRYNCIWDNEIDSLWSTI